MQPLQTQASELVRSLSEQCTGPTLLGSMSPSVYDTAWVSMVRREVNGNPTFLFPESFTYLLETQLADGTWPLYSTRVDGILNTLAALLALKVRSRHDAPSHLDLKERCSKAEKALTIMLADWDARSSDRVGLELLLPCLLRLLGNEGVHLSFPDFDYLSNMGKLKMNRLGQLLYSGKQTTLLHSLDAVVDAVNFDELRSQKLENGSMMNSPSSTAAYLMNISVWDDQAEAYLRSVMDQSLSRGYRGGVASAFPSPIFELSWV